MKKPKNLKTDEESNSLKTSTKAGKPLKKTGVLKADEESNSLKTSTKAGKPLKKTGVLKADEESNSLKTKDGDNQMEKGTKSQIKKGPAKNDTLSDINDLSKKDTKSQQIPLAQTGITKIVSEEDTLVVKAKSQRKNPAVLLLLNGPAHLVGFSWPLKNLVTNVGRSQRLNDINIPHNSLSKSHFQIIREKGKFYIVDLKSTNKTYINDREIEPYQKIALQNNAYIQASSLSFKFLDKGNIESFASKQVSIKAHTDSLTKAGNRHLLKTNGPRYFSENSTLSLIVFDIDDFKIINDNFGHSAGDYVLKILSKYVRKIIREEDMFIRYGGDEFCLFSPHPLSVAENIASRIKNKLKKNKFIFKEQPISVDISIGLAEKSLADKKWEDIYHRADQQSYENKKKKKAS